MDGCHEVASSPHHFITLNVLVDLGSGDGRVALTAAQMNPKVRGDRIEGTARVSLPPHEKTVELPWRATKTETSAYFAPTGTNLE